MRFVTTKAIDDKRTDERSKQHAQYALVWNENLFEFIFLFGQFQTPLSNVPIRCFPHVVIFDDTLETFPWQLSQECSR